MLLASFGAAQFIGSPFFGWLADRTVSRRLPFLLGLVMNMSATLLLCLATNVWLLLLSRFAQGLSAAAVYTVGFSLLADTTGSKNLGEWMGYIFLSVNLGMTVSPTLGGLLYDHAGYYSLFIVLLSLIVVDILLRIAMIEKRVAATWTQDAEPARREPSASYGTITPGCEGEPGRQDNETVTSSSPSLEHGPELPNDGHQDPKAARVAPLISLLSSARVWADLYGACVSVTLLVSFDSTLPLFAERTFGWGPTEVGLLFLTITLPIMGAPLAGKLTDMRPSQWTSPVGFLLVGILTVLLLLVKRNSTEHILLLCVLLTANGANCRFENPSDSSIDDIVGCVRVVSSTPLAVDLSRAIEDMERQQPGLFGGASVYAQVFSLYTSASAAGILIGPLWGSIAEGGQNWDLFVSTLGAFCVSAAVPLVSLRHG